MKVGVVVTQTRALSSAKIVKYLSASVPSLLTMSHMPGPFVASHMGCPLSVHGRDLTRWLWHLRLQEDCRPSLSLSGASFFDIFLSTEHSTMDVDKCIASSLQVGSCFGVELNLVKSK